VDIHERIGELSMLLWETAQEVDVSYDPPRRQMEMLAEAGYFAFAANAGPRDRRRLLDLLSSGCGATAFLASQHEGACRRLLRIQHPLFGKAAKGQAWVGVCFAHLRRRPCPVTVVPRDHSLIFDGIGPWFSGLGLMEHVLLAGATEGDEFLMSLCRVDAPGISLGDRPRLAVMNATATVPLNLQGLAIPRVDLVVRSNPSEMGQTDMHHTVFQSARSLGVARAAGRYLPQSAAQRLLKQLQEQHEKMDAWDGEPEWSSATLLRKEAMSLATAALQAALACVGGSAHSLEHPLQRLAREATFYTTTQLTAELRQAYLDELHQG
jgi:alkylation response protein AidB-like acyl-CoA dehydrogenase